MWGLRMSKLHWHIQNVWHDQNVCLQNEEEGEGQNEFIKQYLERQKLLLEGGEFYLYRQCQSPFMFIDQAKK